MNLLVRSVEAQQVLVDSIVDLMRNAQMGGLDTPELRDRIREEYLKLVDMYADFVRKNNDLDIAPFIIKMYIAQFFEMKDMKALYDVLTERVKATSFGKLVAEDFYESPELIAGTTAPDFTLNDKDNKTIKLSDYRGRYLVISFWGSWCKPCRVSHPKFVETVNKYKSKGLQVLGIAADRDIQQWLDAIKEDKLNWLQVNAFSEQPLDILALYTIKAFPTKVIIDPQGMYLGQYVGDDPEFYTFLEGLYK
jgi:peroxiredoxin